jgi:hypothetical protein
MPPTGDSLPPIDAWIELPDQRRLSLAGDCRIGRGEGNEIVNPDTRISRHHAVVQRQGDRFVLVDFGSTNGTFLNDSRIFKPTKLKDGDVILVGSLSYVFRQPSEAASPLTNFAQNTVVAVGKTSCWMLLVAPPEPPGPPAAAWAEQVRQALVGGGAGIKRLPGAAFIAHWRDSRIAPEAVRAIILDIAGVPIPRGAYLTLHYGAVRIGPATSPGEENLLGADVSFTHKLAASAAGLGVSFLVSEPAARLLGPARSVSPLGSQAVRDTPGTHLLFTIATR